MFPKFLLLSVIGGEPLAVEVILKTRKRPPRTTKVLKNPRRHPAKKRNTFQHDDLMLVKSGQEMGVSIRSDC